ncbi:hypothetical protein [Schlesneria sp. DSM 10557]|uniref:hypothetical protein n=1 Tax=Schlesneria sp. DSM 10557 TaxID=3044399 RepID=UPI0035A04E4D
MSGPKYGYIRPSFRGSLRSACTTISRACSRWGTPLAIDELEKELKEARRQCRELRVAAEKQNVSPRIGELLDRMDARREDLVLLFQEEGRKLEQAQVTRQVLDQELKSGSLAAGDLRASESHLGTAEANLNRAHRDAEAANSAARPAVQRFQNGLRELQLWRSEVEQVLKPRHASLGKPAPEESLQAVQERLGREVELAALKEEVSKLEVEPEGGWDAVRRWVTSQATIEECLQQLKAARCQLEAGNIGRARSAIERAKSQRAGAIAEAEQNRQNSERTQQIADAIMQALFDRNYDSPKYGLMKDGDPLSGIQVRADVPNRDGRGNIRVDIHLDGRTEFEIENVVEGEEKLCRDVLSGLSESLVHEGLELDITDWGRAKDTHPGPDEGTKIPVKFKEPEREREYLR